MASRRILQYFLTMCFPYVPVYHKISTEGYRSAHKFLKAYAGNLNQKNRHIEIIRRHFENFYGQNQRPNISIF